MARPRTSWDPQERRASKHTKTRRRDLSGTPPKLSAALASAMAARWDLDEAAQETGLDPAALDGFMAGGELTLAHVEAIGAALGLRLCWSTVGRWNPESGRSDRAAVNVLRAARLFVG